MGGNFSKDDKSKANNIYAELITGKSPPIKVLLNEQITSTAVDSLKDSLNDSKEFVNLFANNLVIEVLKDKNTAKTFGNFLNYTFSFESTKAPTRSLIYWSIMSDTSIGNISLLSTTQICTWMNLYGKNQIVDVLDHYLLRKSFQTIYIHPLLLWTLQQEHIVISPLSNIIADSLLYTKVSSIFSISLFTVNRCVELFY